MREIWYCPDSFNFFDFCFVSKWHWKSTNTCVGGGGGDEGRNCMTKQAIRFVVTPLQIPFCDMTEKNDMIERIESSAKERCPFFSNTVHADWLILMTEESRGTDRVCLQSFRVYIAITRNKLCPVWLTESAIDSLYSCASFIYLTVLTRWSMVYALTFVCLVVKHCTKSLRKSMFADIATI